MYSLFISKEADRIFGKLSRKNPKQLEIIWKKINEIRGNPLHSYKFLSKPLEKFNRVHIDKHFVLIFKLNHLNKSVEVYHFAHHDKAYSWRPE